jgi:hypothetical protein
MYSLRVPSATASALIEQDVSFAIQHFIALLDGTLADSLRQVAFAGPAGAEKQRVFALVDEPAGSQIEHQTAIHFRIESEVEAVECAVGVAKASLFAAALQ